MNVLYIRENVGHVIGFSAFQRKCSPEFFFSLTGFHHQLFLSFSALVFFPLCRQFCIRYLIKIVRLLQFPDQSFINFLTQRKFIYNVLNGAVI